MGIVKKKDLEEKFDELKRDELGLNKIEACHHIFRKYTTRETMGEFIRVRVIYRCIYCGITTTYTWSEHV